MKLEYLDDISEGGKYPWADPNQLVRLYDFTYFEVKELSYIVQRGLIDSNIELNLNSLPFIHEINCNLILRVSSIDIGITTLDKQTFYCDLSKSGYRQITALIEPFCQESKTGYQWLYDLDTPTDFLLSTDGSW